MTDAMIRWDYVQITDTLTRAEQLVLGGFFDDGFELFVLASDGINDIDSPTQYLAAAMHAERVMREVILPNMGMPIRIPTDGEVQ